MYRNQKTGGKNRFFQRKKICRFCVDNALELNYKNPKALRQFITERGKIMPRRITGTCAKHQRQLSLAIKQSRQIALLPFVGRPMH
ncbi:MAG: 30S ribosomal protein S18 [Proteobacteria bacterium]|nr:30S ribosomal protein S18 [Desulfobacula sp.]MBU0972536.1 30S ribosomal protein S18 [Pseudomonadota bacterium]MBU3953312.1 30S ribosomal protein S18 [Pseudomonadota bacterium]MBU4132396.1 30S ribosomal protein S18 [Pseudomonadota bacterium]